LGSDPTALVGVASELTYGLPYVYNNFPCLCVDQDFSNFFAHVPPTIKYIISQHFVYAGVTRYLYKSYNVFLFSLDQIILEPVPKTFRCRGQSWSLKLSFGSAALQGTDKTHWESK